MTEYKTDMNITKIDKYKKTEQHFFDGAQNRQEHCWKTEYHFYEGTQNRTQLHFGEPENKHIQIQQKSNKPQNSPRKRLTKTFNQQLTSTHYLYP